MLTEASPLKPKIEDVAKRAGVSPTTVSRVMNNRGYISEKTRSLVYNAMEELNYVPNEMVPDRCYPNKATL